MSQFADGTYFRCIADDGCDGVGFLPTGYTGSHIIVVTVKGISFCAVADAVTTTEAENAALLRACYSSPAWLPYEMLTAGS